MNIHLACGTVKIPGFVNVDARQDVMPDVVCDIKNLSPFEAHSADIIYLCHGLEHFKYREVDGVLQGFRRVLKPGGKLYLAMPDMERLSYYYTAGWLSLSLIRGAISGGQEYPGNIHYSVWDLPTLKQALVKNGFVDVQRYYAGDLLPKGIIDWSIRGIQGECISLNVVSTSL